MSPCNSSRLWLGMTMFASIFRNGSHSENCWLPAVSNWKLQVIPCKWLVERYFGPDPIVAQKAILFFDSSSFFCSQSNNKPATFWCFVQPIHFAIFGRIIGELWEAWGWFMILWLLTSNTNDVFKPTFSSADSPPSALRCNAATLCKASLSRVSRDLKQCTPERCATATTGTVGL